MQIGVKYVIKWKMVKLYGKETKLMVNLRHYTCLTNHYIYRREYNLCDAQCIGQITLTILKCHYGHRQEVKGGFGWS